MVTRRLPNSEATCASITEVSGTPDVNAVVDAAIGGEARSMTSASKNALISPCSRSNVSWFVLEEGLEKPVRSLSLNMHLMIVARASQFMLVYVPTVEARARSRASAASRSATSFATNLGVQEWQQAAWQPRE